MQIYEAYGYTARDAASSIVKNNLYGLDIDDRAAQLAYFAVMMKACQYDRRFLSRGIQPHVYAIMESNSFDTHMIDLFTDGRKELKSAMSSLISDLHDAKEYGSILNVKPVDFPTLYARFDEIRNGNPNLYAYQILDELLPFVQMAEVMAQKYHAVVTNPPYMNANGMNAKLNSFLKKNYPDTRSDLSTVFMSKAFDFCVKNGYMAMINIPVWMFITSYENLRKDIIHTKTFINVLHLGRGIFGSDFGTTSFVIQNTSVRHKKSKFYKLYLRQGEVDSVEEKERMFFDRIGEYISTQDYFDAIPDSPIAYWASSALLEDFTKGHLVSEFSSPRQGMSTCDVNRFTRLWFEVSINRSNVFYAENKDKWIRYNKGGSFRKWYGNREFLVDWSGSGELLLSNGAVLRNRDMYFKPFIAWTKISSAGTGFRTFEENFLFDGAGGSLFNRNNGLEDYYLLGLLNSKVDTLVLNLISPTLNFNENHIGSIPVISCKDISTKKEINSLVDYNIKLSRNDWDSFENSWDFQKHPMIRNTRTIKEAFTQWKTECEARFNQLKSNEEELNRIFIDIYGLQDELTPEEEEKDVTVRKADLERDIRSFVSYAVGCMFGRYSLDEEGLAYAGGDWDSSKYKTFIPDKDAIIPITDDEYFTDDIVGRFVEFVKDVYGADTLEENLKFIADALGEKGATSREVIRNYFIKDFYKDHCKTYRKRPIYWLFDSGKKNGFKCLIYMHRYQPDTIARIRTDYVHEQQARYRTAISGLERQINGASTSDRVRLNKQLTKLKDQAEETRLYEEKIHHLADQMISIDLDDGVKHNYAIFQDVLAKIK